MVTKLWIQRNISIIKTRLLFLEGQRHRERKKIGERKKKNLTKNRNI